VGIGTVTTGSYRFNSTRADGNVAFFTDGTSADLFIKTTAGVATISPTTGILALGTSSTERMRIDSSGNVGIGTDAPALPLSVDGDIWQGNTGGVEIGRITNNAGWYDFGASSNVNGAQMSHPAIVRFNTASTERMRIDSGGNVRVGTTAAAYLAGERFSIVSASSGSMGVGVRGAEQYLMGLWNQTIGTSTMMVFASGPGTGVGSISTNGSSVAYNTSSDYRLKENITPVQGAADIVKMMRPCTYTFKSDGSWHDGFLAHELQELHPRAVIGEKDAMKDEEYEVTPAVEATYDDEGVELTPAEPAVMGTRSVPDYQGVDYSKLTPILTAALQEALNKIDALEARLTALEAV